MAAVEKKIIEGLERISALHRHLMWEAAYANELSATQAQILLHLAEANDHISSLTMLAQVMQMSHGTVSDATKVLVQKQLVTKKADPDDKRKYVLLLTKKGATKATELSNFSDPLLQVVTEGTQANNLQLFEALVSLIYRLHMAGRFPTQRMCMTCRHYDSSGKSAYCKLLEQRLDVSSIRLNCAEHEAIN